MTLVWSAGSGPPPPREEIGGKASALARLSDLAAADGAGFTVPPWFVIAAGASDATGAVPPELRAAVRDAVTRLGPAGRRVAVRSSAAAEDGALASFAGQFDSVLGVAVDDDAALWDAVRRVRASAASAHATAYGARAGDVQRVRMAVVVQAMADPDVSGVAFSVDPVSSDRATAVVSAVPGLGEGLVSGALDADTFRVRRDHDALRVTGRHVVAKPRAVRMGDGGTVLRDTAAAERDAAALGDDEVLAVARCAVALERAFGAPQDVEWAIERAAATPLVVLQSRPITGLARVVRDERRVWDNSNIVESYAGVTTPMTFSFARAVYEDVYRQFCRVMGVPEPLIAAHSGVYAHLLGLHRGRVYYNLLNWYRVLGLLPGFSFNRGFMERMMGVRERLEDPPPPPRSGRRLLDLLHLCRSVASIAWQGARLGRRVPAFHARVDAQLAPIADRDLTATTGGQLVALYHHLERQLLHHWRTPLVNDFFAMVSFGMLGRAIERWLPDLPPTLANDLLCGEGGIVSTEPSRAVMALARRVAGDAALSAAFARQPDAGALWGELHADVRFADFARSLDAYVRRFGDRTMNELKLETRTLREDPGFLLQTIREYARHGAPDPDAAREREREVRRAAEARVRERLRGVRAVAFAWITARTRARVRDRENLRFERTRVFGVVRRIVLALGTHLARAGRLDDARDVFYLTIEELFADFEGTGVVADLRSLVRLRRAEFERWAAEPAPPDRFETNGPPVPGVPAPAAPAPSAGRELRGLGCSPGVVRAPVRIVHDPAHASGLAGHILVAERTDPGWTLLFPAALGLLVQRGSLLSHSAIVARELALPCIVGIPGLLDTLEDGETVEMDGTTGLVRRAGA